MVGQRQTIFVEWSMLRRGGVEEVVLESAVCRMVCQQRQWEWLIVDGIGLL